MVNAFTKLLAASFGIVLGVTAIVGAGQAKAAATASWDASDIGLSETIYFDGVSDAYLHHTTPVPGLTSKLTLTLDSIVNNHWVFTYDIANTSSAPIDSSRVTVFGFDVLQPYAGVTS